MCKTDRHTYRQTILLLCCFLLRTRQLGLIDCEPTRCDQNPRSPISGFYQTTVLWSIGHCGTWRVLVVRQQLRRFNFHASQAEADTDRTLVIKVLQLIYNNRDFTLQIRFFIMVFEHILLINNLRSTVKTTEIYTCVKIGIRNAKYKSTS